MLTLFLATLVMRSVLVFVTANGQERVAVNVIQNTMRVTTVLPVSMMVRMTWKRILNATSCVLKVLIAMVITLGM